MFKNRSIQLKNRKKIFCGLLLLISMFFLNIQNITASEPTEQVLEDLIRDRILELYLVKNGKGGFTDGSTSGINWYDTLDALESLELLSYNLSLAYRTQIAEYVMAERATETQYEIKNVTLEDLNINKTQLLENQTDSELVPNEETITWWGGVKKSVEALRLLQLVDRLNTTIIKSVKNWILHHFDDSGLNWNLGSPGWEDLYWGFYKPMEWGLFTLMPELGLFPLSPSTLSYLDGKDIEISEEVLFSTDVPIKWISEQDLSQDEIILSTNPLQEFTRVPISIPRINDLFPDNFVTNYVPTPTLVVDWTAIRNETTPVIMSVSSSKGVTSIGGLVELLNAVIRRINIELNLYLLLFDPLALSGDDEKSNYGELGVLFDFFFLFNNFRE